MKIGFTARSLYGHMHYTLCNTLCYVQAFTPGIQNTLRHLQITKKIATVVETSGFCKPTTQQVVKAGKRVLS